MAKFYIEHSHVSPLQVSTFGSPFNGIFVLFFFFRVHREFDFRRQVTPFPVRRGKITVRIRLTHYNIGYVSKNTFCLTDGFDLATVISIRVVRVIIARETRARRQLRPTAHAVHVTRFTKTTFSVLATQGFFFASNLPRRIPLDHCKRTYGSPERFADGLFARGPPLFFRSVALVAIVLICH